MFSSPVRALVPMLYTVRRIFVIIDWMHDVWIDKALTANAHVKVIDSEVVLVHNLELSLVKYELA